MGSKEHEQPQQPEQQQPPPRKRAAAPRFDALPEFRDPDAVVAPPPKAPEPFPLEPEERLAVARQEPRIGGAFVNYSMWAGGAAVAFTYLTGFRHLWQKDRPAWMGTFRQRLVIMAPIMTMYAAGSGILPMPFRTTLESMLGRPAVTLSDYDKVRRKEREERKRQEELAKRQAAEEFADLQASQGQKQL